MLKIQMRYARPLFLLALLVILAAVGATYYARLKQQFANAPAKPKPLAPGTAASYHSWTYTHTSNQKTVIKVSAQDTVEVEGKQQLTGVELEIYHKDGNQYDYVKSAKAEFDMRQGILYSDGEVEITMGVQVDEPPSGRLMTIKSSGVRVESKTGKASTDRLATFRFDRGQGQALGADYDPDARELRMHSQVELIWRGTDPGTTPMKVEAGEAEYKERERKVYLSPWSKLTRDALTLNAGPAVASLASGSPKGSGTLQRVETTQARGVDQRPDRNLEYSANQLSLEFNGNNQIQKITGMDQARLVSTADTAITTVTADRVAMDFDTTGGGSLLETAVATGHSQMESKPVLRPGVDPADTRILKSDTIRTKMRPGGQELESVETDSPGAIEFIPNRPGQPHRWMNGERISIAYGEKNQIQSFRSSAASTRTEKPKLKDAKDAPAPVLTSSKELVATFQPNSSQLAKLEQSNDFRYQEGDRRAKADRAVLDQANNRIDLRGAARVWDSTGSADADKIVLDQKSGDFSAEGNVSSTRLPDQTNKPSDSGGMLSESEPLHARAAKMSSTENNLQIRYEGHAVLWQGPNRLEGDVVEIDRDNGVLNVHGHVVSQLLDKSKSGDPPKDGAKPKTASKQAASGGAATNPGPPVFTVVRAPELQYNDEQRIAHYKEGALLERPNMQVKAREIRAFLRNDSKDSSLDHAFADGNVVIAQTAPGRLRSGASEHVEYYVDEDKVILEGGKPQFVDSIRGKTQGEKLTWFSRDDRLLVNGVPAKSVLRRKK
ncbi:MAG TPA: LPS export ABC transporter periplasmic protein LptC [Bryobacteraceae bacterium]|nr:LPS export ABC transporter periplasmic protein LptC [Bryobacteraceae bacterium]